MKKSIEEHLTKWSINESLLQSYRQIFIGSQSFLLAVGAILIPQGVKDWLLYAIAAIGLFIIWYVWFRAVRVRALIVDYHKYTQQYLSKNQKKPKGICTEGQYVDFRQLNKRRETNCILGIEKNWRLTRIKIDLLLPIVYSLIWILLSLHKLFS